MKTYYKIVSIIVVDAQNGPDHVDSNRSTAYLADGYLMEDLVDHTLYSTTSMLHTI